MLPLPLPWEEAPRLLLQAADSPPPPGPLGVAWCLDASPLPTCIGVLTLLAPSPQEAHAVQEGHLTGAAFLDRYHARFAPRHFLHLSPPRYRRGLPPGIESLRPGSLQGRLYDSGGGQTHRTVSTSPERPDRLLSRVGEAMTWAARSLRAWAGCYLMEAGWKVDFGRTLEGTTPQAPPWVAECSGEILHFRGVPTPPRFFGAPLVNFDFSKGSTSERLTLSYPRLEEP